MLGAAVSGQVQAAAAAAIQVEAGATASSSIQAEAAAATVIQEEAASLLLRLWRACVRSSNIGFLWAEAGFGPSRIPSVSRTYPSRVHLFLSFFLFENRGILRDSRVPAYPGVSPCPAVSERQIGNFCRIHAS